MRKASYLVASVLGMACLGAPGSASGDDMAEGQKTQAGASIQVLIKGGDDTRYAAVWTVTADNGTQQLFETSGQVPAHYVYRGREITGTVTVLSTSGRLEVEILKNGNRSRSSTQGLGSVLRMTVR